MTDVKQIWRGDNATGLQNPLLTSISANTLSVPPRVASQRSIAFGSFFGLCLGAAFFIFVYYIPIWFQAIKGVSATQSGIDNLGLLLAQVIGTILSGILTTTFGYYVPFMLVSPVLMAVGAGLLTTWNVDTPISQWIGYQIILGIGSGLGFQQPLIAAQTVLPIKDVPTGTSIVLFVQILGGALFISVAQNIFSNKLVEGVTQIPGVDPAMVIQTGATQLKDLFHDPSVVNQVLVAYNAALVKVYQIALIMGCLAILGAFGMEWKSVKGKKIEPAAA